MPLTTLSWDLLIIVCFAIAVSYGFIAGRTQTVRLILGAYVAAIATHGVTIGLQRIIELSPTTWMEVGLPADITAFALLKIFLFSLFLILFMLKSGVDIKYGKDSGTIINTIMTALLSFAAAGLIISTFLLALAGGDTFVAAPLAAPLPPLLGGSTLVQLMILNHTLWLTLPAVILFGAAFA